MWLVLSLTPTFLTNTHARYKSVEYISHVLHILEVLSCAYTLCIYYQVMASVRCLQWWGDSYVLIGCLDGRVCKWKLGDEETEEVSHLDGSVIIMRWNHKRTVSLHMFLYML